MRGLLKDYQIPTRRPAVDSDTVVRERGAARRVVGVDRAGADGAGSGTRPRRNICVCPGGYRGCYELKWLTCGEAIFEADYGVDAGLSVVRLECFYSRVGKVSGGDLT